MRGFGKGQKKVGGAGGGGGASKRLGKSRRGAAGKSA